MAYEGGSFQARALARKADAYLLSIAKTHMIVRDPMRPLVQYAPYAAAVKLTPVIRAWAGTHLRKVIPAGSWAKGTALRGTTDIDLMFSFSSQTPLKLGELYNGVHDLLWSQGYAVRKQNVTIGIELSGFHIDVLPAMRQPGCFFKHSIYRQKQDTWTLTNVHKHVELIRTCGRLTEIVLLKRWRNCHGLDFPSFYLELSALRALKGVPRTFGSRDLAQRFLRVLRYLSEEFEDAKIDDPANSGNTVSDDLTVEEKRRIASCATTSYDAPWEQTIW